MKNDTPKTDALLGKILDETGVLNQSNAPESWVKLCRELETALQIIAEYGGKELETECGPISCNGSWCAEQARSAVYVANAASEGC